jgi:multidrug efflux pump subunit AcrB
MLDLRSTLISSIALPTSVISTFFIMYVLNFTLNMMTLLGLSLAIGLLIDDAVVVRENISKHLERGVPPREAALAGTKEIALSVFATTLTIVAVFVPVAFMSGIVGQFFRQFGFTITGAVLMSLLVAFTVDPMLSSIFSKAHVPGAPEPFARLKAPFRFVLDGIDHLYRVILTWAVHHKFLVFLLATLPFFGSCGLAGLLGSDFVNEEDRGQFVVDVELPAGTKLSETARILLPAEKELLEDKRFTTVLSRLGPDGEVNRAKWRVLTVPKSERSVKLGVLQDQVRATLKKIAPEAKVAITPPPFIEGAATEAQIMIQVRGPTYDDLVPLTKKFESAMKAIPGIADVNMKYSPGQPELRVSVDRDRAAAAGIPVAQVALALRAAMEGNEGGKLRQGKDEIPIRVRLGHGDRESLKDVLRMTIQTPKGQMALSDLAHVERGEGPSVIDREGRERQIVIWAAPKGRSLGDIVPELQKAFGQIKMPPGCSFYYDGQIRQMNESNASMAVAFGLAIIFIFIVLASQFESFIHPVTIMLTLPLAIVGGIVALFIAQTTIAMGALIGFILLIGLVTKNAILLLDRALVRVREHGETPLQAIQEAGPERLRPILMTSAAMILGMLPTALANGEGSEFRAPMAIAVIGGVISSTLLSLVVVPAFYLTVEKLKAFARRIFVRLFSREPPPFSARPAE